MLCIRLGFSHSTTYGLVYSICGQPINLMVIHLLQHFDKEECISTHDTIWDAFTSIAKDARFHVFCEQIHVLPSPSLESLHWWVNMVFTIDGFHKLANVIIINSIWEDLVLVQNFFLKEWPWQLWSQQRIDYITINTLKIFGLLGKKKYGPINWLDC
jgi:hypothetical protein